MGKRAAVQGRPLALVRAYAANTHQITSPQLRQHLRDHAITNAFYNTLVDKELSLELITLIRPKEKIWKLESRCSMVDSAYQRPSVVGVLLLVSGGPMRWCTAVGRTFTAITTHLVSTFFFGFPHLG